MAQVTFAGNPMPLKGTLPEVGMPAPDFTAQKNDLSPFRFSETAGKVRLISVVPSVDTGVCSLQTRHFNEDAVALGPDVTVITVSMDLPFAQKRFCAAEGIDRVVTVSDHIAADFGTRYGFLIEPLRLLARGIVVVDRRGVVRYVEQVDEVTHEVNFDAALAAAKELL